MTDTQDPVKTIDDIDTSTILVSLGLIMQEQFDLTRQIAERLAALAEQVKVLNDQLGVLITCGGPEE